MKCCACGVREPHPRGRSGRDGDVWLRALCPRWPPQGEDVPPEECSLPDSVVIAMLRREVLLTRAKLHWLVFEHITQEKALRTLKAQLRQVRARLVREGCSLESES